MNHVVNKEYTTQELNDMELLVLEDPQERYHLSSWLVPRCWFDDNRHRVISFYTGENQDYELKMPLEDVCTSVILGVNFMKTYLQIHKVIPINIEKMSENWSV